MLYFQSVVSPLHFVLAKLLFNSLLMLLMSGLSLLLFSLFFTNPAEKLVSFVGLVFLGGWSLSLVFSFLAAIAVKAQQNAAIMAILGFPLIIPQLIMLMKVSSAAFSASATMQTTPILMLVVMNILVILKTFYIKKSRFSE
jgi:heme exporter protein B